MRTYIIAGNWKMNLGPTSAREFAASLLEQDAVRAALSTEHSVLVCPPFVSIQSAAEVCSGSGLHVGAQDCHAEPKGAYTGDVSATMLSELGCTWVIVGHSERRRDHHETNDVIGKKALAALKCGIRPIICVGESLEDRQRDATQQVVTEQLEQIARSIGADALQKCVIAYEPIWAIGTGLAASPEQAQEVHSWIRQTLSAHGGTSVPILYGGSVTDANAPDLFQQPDIDGALIGGASLNATSFAGIVQAALTLGAA